MKLPRSNPDLWKSELLRMSKARVLSLSSLEGPRLVEIVIGRGRPMPEMSTTLISANQKMSTAFHSRGPTSRGYVFLMTMPWLFMPASMIMMYTVFWLIMEVPPMSFSTISLRKCLNLELT